MPDNKIEEVQKVLGTPFSGDLPDNALKVRRNLLAASLISIILVMTGAKVDPASTLFGIRFTDLKVDHVPLGLLTLNLYFLVHYLWYAIEAFLEWRLRLTGTKLAFQTGATFGSECEDHHTDPRQSTLSNWWVSQRQMTGLLDAPLSEMEKKISKFEVELASLKGDSNGLNFSEAATKLGSIKSDISNLKGQLQSTVTTIESARIPASLERFDNWFQLSLRTQSLRWILIDLSLPVVMGLTASVLLTWQALGS